MPKHRILDILRRKSQIKKIKTQSELKDNLSRIESTKKLETDLDFNIDETIEIGVEQVGYNHRVKSQLRQNMMAQKEIVENIACAVGVALNRFSKTGKEDRERLVGNAREVFNADSENRERRKQHALEVLQEKRQAA